MIPRTAQRTSLVSGLSRLSILLGACASLAIACDDSSGDSSGSGGLPDAGANPASDGGAGGAPPPGTQGDPDDCASAVGVGRYATNGSNRLLQTNGVAVFDHGPFEMSASSQRSIAYAQGKVYVMTVTDGVHVMDPTVKPLVATKDEALSAALSTGSYYILGGDGAGASGRLIAAKRAGGVMGIDLVSNENLTAVLDVDPDESTRCWGNFGEVFDISGTVMRTSGMVIQTSYDVTVVVQCDDRKTRIIRTTGTTEGGRASLSVLAASSTADDERFVATRLHDSQTETVFKAAATTSFKTDGYVIAPGATLVGCEGKPAARIVHID